MLINNKYTFLTLMLIFLSVFGMIGFRFLAHLKWLYYLVIIAEIFSSMNKKDYFFKKPLILFLICILVNGIASSIRNDEPILSFLDGESSILIPFCMYFYFMKTKLSIDTLENILIILCFIFCIAYIVQFVSFPKVIFQGAMAEGLDSELRFRLTGQCLGSLSFLLGMNKLLFGIRIKYVGLMVLGLLVTLILGFRSQMVALALSALFMFVRVKGLKIKSYLKYSLVSSVFIISFVQIPIVQNKIEEMFARNETANFDNENYIRLITYDYYVSELNKSPISYIIGLGLPGSNSQYQRDTDRLKHFSGIIWADWGLIGLSWMLGIPGTLIIIYIFLRTFSIKVPKEYYYISFNFLFLILASLFTREIYRVGAFFIHAFLLMLINKISILNNERQDKSIVYKS